MAMGMIGHFVLVAILKLPSWKGSIHFFFGNVAGADRAAAVGEEDVKVASVIPDIQDRGVLRYILLSYHCDFGSCDPQDKSKYSLNDPKRADILGHRRKFADDPFYQ